SFGFTGMVHLLPQRKPLRDFSHKGLLFFLLLYILSHLSEKVIHDFTHSAFSVFHDIIIAHLSAFVIHDITHALP
ncbi:MAG: hypothetical protein IKC40_06185, partial [Oscillospiraceae bacterium]|nr:hypothetical protein [Oscillospiraceae bacterium]